MTYSLAYSESRCRLTVGGRLGAAVAAVEHAVLADGDQPAAEAEAEAGERQEAAGQRGRQRHLPHRLPPAVVGDDEPVTVRRHVTRVDGRVAAVAAVADPLGQPPGALAAQRVHAAVDVDQHLGAVEDDLLGRDDRPGVPAQRRAHGAVRAQSGKLAGGDQSAVHTVLTAQVPGGDPLETGAEEGERWLLGRPEPLAVPLRRLTAAPVELVGRGHGYVAHVERRTARVTARLPQLATHASDALVHAAQVVADVAVASGQVAGLLPLGGAVALAQRGHVPTQRAVVSAAHPRLRHDLGAVEEPVQPLALAVTLALRAGERLKMVRAQLRAELVLQLATAQEDAGARAADRGVDHAAAAAGARETPLGARGLRALGARGGAQRGAHSRLVLELRRQRLLARLDDDEAEVDERHARDDGQQLAQADGVTETTLQGRLARTGGHRAVVPLPPRHLMAGDSPIASLAGGGVVCRRVSPERYCITGTAKSTSRKFDIKMFCCPWLEF